MARKSAVQKTQAQLAEEIKQKQMKFAAIASKRMTSALKAISNIGKLGTKTYLSTEDQRTKISSALSAAVTRTVNALSNQTGGGSDFKF